MASILGFANMPSTSRRVPATRSYALRASASSIEPHQARPERTAECTPPLQSSSGRAAAAGVAAMAALLPAAPALALAQQQPLEQALWDVAELDSATAGLLLLVLKPLLTVGSLLMVARIVMTWYPEIDGKALPWSIAYLPTGACAPTPSRPLESCSCSATSGATTATVS